MATLLDEEQKKEVIELTIRYFDLNAQLYLIQHQILDARLKLMNAVGMSAEEVRGSTTFADAIRKHVSQ